MAIDVNPVHFVLYGNVTTNDIWNSGYWGDTGSVLWSQSELDTFTAALLADFNTNFWSNATSPWKAQVNSSGNLTGVKAYLYDTALNLQRESVATMSPQAGTGTNLHPGYVAQVFTFVTLKFGRSYRGRMYMPATGCGINAGASTNSTLVQAHADHLSTHLANVGSGLGTTVLATPAVLSRAKGALTAIETVKVDNHLDTQRGRVSQSLPTSTFTHAV